MINSLTSEIKLEEALKGYTKTVDDYISAPFKDLFETAELMKDLCIILSILTSHKVKHENEWNAKCFALVNDKGMTGTAAEKIANKEHPEANMLRQLLRAGNQILDTMRSHVSLLKSEK